MAGDWIKMRTSLVNHTKVREMAASLSRNPKFVIWFTGSRDTSSVTQNCASRDVSRDVTVTSPAVTALSHSDRQIVTLIVNGGLLAVWSSANVTATEDGLLAGTRLELLDDVAGVPGFGEAMELVGWAKATEEGVILPNFNEYNTVGKARSKKTSGASRTAKWRAKKAAESQSAGPVSCSSSDENSTVTGSVTVTNCDTSHERHGDDRIDKNREEKNKEKKDRNSARVPPACAPAPAPPQAPPLADGELPFAPDPEPSENTFANRDPREANLTPQGLAWNYRQVKAAKGTLIAQESELNLIDVFTDLTKSGVPERAIMDEIRRKDRKTREPIWDFEKRMESKYAKPKTDRASVDIPASRLVLQPGHKSRITEIVAPAPAVPAPGPEREPAVSAP